MTLRLLALLAMFASTVLTSSAWAQGRGDGSKDEDRAAAQALFDEGQALTTDGKWAEACAKFEASQKLDPSVGTQLNLAKCFEELGKTASAWINYHEVAQAGSARRNEFAQEEAARLEPNLVRLHLVIKNRLPGMTVMRGEEPMEEPTWNEPVPVDPGTYDIVVKAPGYSPWRKTVKLQDEGEIIEVTVPALIEDPNAKEAPAPIAPPAEEPSDNGQLIAGAVVGALGLVGIGVGVGLAVVGHKKNDDSLAFCPDDPNMCTAPGVALREEAQGLQAGYLGAFIVGGAALVAGIVVMVTAPSASGDDGDAVEAQLRIYPGGIGLTGRF